MAKPNRNRRACNAEPGASGGVMKAKAQKSSPAKELQFELKYCERCEDCGCVRWVECKSIVRVAGVKLLNCRPPRTRRRTRRCREGRVGALTKPSSRVMRI